MCLHTADTAPFPTRLQERLSFQHLIHLKFAGDACKCTLLRDGKELTNTVCVDATADCEVRVDPPKVKVTAPRGGAFERKFRKPPKKKKKKDEAEL